MESISSVTKKYNKLMNDIATKGFYKRVEGDRFNCYTCQSCGHITKTRDIDSGVTPFSHACEKCKGRALSSFYKDIRPDIKPSQEWYRPSLQEVLKLRKNAPLLEHVLKGGLLSRIIQD